MTTLGKYELLEELGRGGFGTVYRARETSLEMIRAVKILHPALVASPEFIERFRREGKITARLDHPHIVPIYELGQEQGYYYLAMKYLPGGSLKDWLALKGKLPFAQALEITRQIAEALDYAQDQPEKLIHRDLKPGNILFERLPDDPKGVSARLSDFGFAKALSNTDSGSLSSSGGLFGTPAYIAPEIWDDMPASPASDQYSLACVLYEMLTGQVLFAGSTPMALMKNVAAGPKFPVAWPDGVPTGINAVLRRALAAKPEDRYPDVAAFTNGCAGLLASKAEKRLKLERKAQVEAKGRIGAKEAATENQLNTPATRRKFPIKQVWSGLGATLLLVVLSGWWASGSMISFFPIPTLVPTVKLTSTFFPSYTPTHLASATLSPAPMLTATIALTRTPTQTIIASATITPSKTPVALLPDLTCTWSKLLNPSYKNSTQVTTCSCFNDVCSCTLKWINGTIIETYYSNKSTVISEANNKKGSCH